MIFSASPCMRLLFHSPIFDYSFISHFLLLNGFQAPIVLIGASYALMLRPHTRFVLPIQFEQEGQPALHTDLIKEGFSLEDFNIEEGWVLLLNTSSKTIHLPPSSPLGTV